MAQDQPITKAQGDVTADLLKQLGMNVDFVATDWGTVGARRAQKTPPGQGGWSMFHTWHAGADCINPAAYIAIRANGDKAWFGWPNVPSRRDGGRGLVRRQEPRRGEGRDRPAQQGGARRRRLRADRLLPGLPGLAQERLRHRQGAAAVLLGRVEDRMTAR